MQQARYAKEPGFVYDLIFIFVLYFNKEAWTKKFVNTDKGQEDIDFYNEILNKFPPFPEELKPFFYFKGSGVCLMSELYFQPNVQMLFNGHGMDFLYNEINNASNMRHNLVNFYIDPNISIEESGNYSVYELSKFLLKQDLPDDVKQMVMLSLMDIKVSCNKIIEIFMMVERVLEEYYREHYDMVVNLCNTVNKDMIENSFKIAENSEYKFDEIELEVSACLININLFRFSFMNSKTAVIIGVNGEEFMKYLGNDSKDIDISLFGKILSDSSRIKVLQMLASEGELFTGEIAQELGTALPSAYYHLEMMMDAKMLYSRNKGRAVYYSINRDYFTAVLAEIMKLIK